MTNEQRESDTSLPWYRVPVLWLGVFITLLILVGCIHLIIVGHRHAGDAATTSQTSDNKQLTHLLGVPLSRETIQTESPQAAAPPAEQP